MCRSELQLLVESGHEHLNTAFLMYLGVMGVELLVRTVNSQETIV